ncbi:amidohydrolase [Frankia sp. Ag45/Mut15]|uniref:Amidohydrolase n=2 Tax=Frankia TaxID=1854 RepID=A0ABT0JUZ9_9ACTN|nr:amidohydrolase family protein [Frankia umida]MCK9875371.1 amidohydrolase [Frankia umida]
MTDISGLAAVFDADNHYWESSDAFTRHRDPAFLDRGLRVVERDGEIRYLLGDRAHPILPGPGDVHPRPRPGALYDYFGGRGDKGSVGAELACEAPADHPDWFQRDARLRRMDEQGLAAVWMFPSHAVCVEGPMQPDIEASIEVLRAFNRWLEEDWGFAYQNRIFGVPFLTLSDLDRAVTELEWCVGRGARVVSIRNGPVFTPEGYRSPADPRFDPFWARVQEAGIVVAPHAGFDDGYREVEAAIAQSWGYHETSRGGDTNAITRDVPFLKMLMKHRLVHDFAAALVAHGLFERFGDLRIAFIENGGTWVGPLLHGLQVMQGQNPGMFTGSLVDQFIEHCWVAPFVEDDVAELAVHLPVERILFGSDWPHAEGLAEPKDFLGGLGSFSAHDRRRIMHDNASELTRPAR